MLVIAYIPCGTEKEAKEISQVLVKERLTACTNIIHSKSIFEWENKLEEDSEWIILAKTVPKRFKELEKRVKEIHPYDLPCILGIPIVEANDDYIAWVENQVK